jgi:hypothetical protein
MIMIVEVYHWYLGAEKFDRGSRAMKLQLPLSSACKTRQAGKKNKYKCEDRAGSMLYIYFIGFFAAIIA